MYYEGDKIRFRGQYAIILEVYEDTEEYLIEMLSTGQTIGIRASLNDINTSMNYKNQNGDIGEVVSAINKLRKDIGNMEHATYQINGITYDDGSNISDAISTIVKAARIGRRV